VAYFNQTTVRKGMSTNVKFWSAIVGLIWIAVWTDRALAITIEVAKKCDALTAKAFPPRVVGNPAAGSTQGTGKERRDYYTKCVANESKTDNSAGKEAK
jgi:hypothetical protein